MPLRSAGVLLYRSPPSGMEVLLVHPGGPFWARKDDGAWSFPKGLIEAGEDEEAAARREFAEETGATLAGPLRRLGAFRQPGGKIITAFTGPGSFDPAAIASNTFQLEWPPRSGRIRDFPEVDRAGWFDEAQALRKIVKGQRAVLDAFFKAMSEKVHV